MAVLPAFIAQEPVAIEERAEVSTTIRYEDLEVEDYGPISDPENVERFVTDYFADIPLLVQVAKCESRYRQLNRGGEVLRGERNRYDLGVMQINELYHGKTATKLGLDLHDIGDNVAYARYLYLKQGAKPWMSSSACWAKFTESEIARR